MVIIDRLVGKNGDARTLLGKRESDGVLDMSGDEWAVRLEVLQRLQFRQVQLAETEVKANFVDCSFEDSEFRLVSSKGHFWAANNRWSHCRFNSVHLEEMISPLNTFYGCHFTGLSLVNYRPFQTLFEQCFFDQCAIFGLRAHLIKNQNQKNPALGKVQATLVFRQCTFVQSIFEESFFEGVAFENCTFKNIKARACEFAGVISDQKWWPQQLSDPFTMFLMKLLDMIRNKCGQASSAYTAMQNYLIDYNTGRTKSKDFSACLYTGKIPDAELDHIEDELPKLMDKFPF